MIKEDQHELFIFKIIYQIQLFWTELLLHHSNLDQFHPEQVGKCIGCVISGPNFHFLVLQLFLTGSQGPHEEGWRRHLRRRSQGSQEWGVSRFGNIEYESCSRNLARPQGCQPFRLGWEQYGPCKLFWKVQVFGLFKWRSETLAKTTTYPRLYIFHTYTN